jgi:CheY-like chemotaxis protein
VTAPARPTVLVVDDHPDAGDSTAELLRLHGYEARVARCGADALALAAAFPPGVVILDLGLPDLDGFELARQLVAALPRRPLLVALTGYNHFEEKSRQAGFDHHFLKPVDPALLARTVGAWAGSPRPAG